MSKLKNQITLDLISNGNKYITYRQYGCRHRTDGPAYLMAGATLTGGWMQYGVFHRLDGPAMLKDGDGGGAHKFCRGEMIPNSTKVGLARLMGR